MTMTMMMMGRASSCPVSSTSGSVTRSGGGGGGGGGRIGIIPFPTANSVRAPPPHSSCRPVCCFRCCSDGTTNFARGYPSSAASAGVLFQGKPAAAAVAQTEVDERLHSQGETRGDEDSVAPLMKHVKVEKQQHVNSNSNNNNIVKRNSLASSLMAAIVALSPTCIAPPAPAVSLAQSITSYTTTTTDVEKGATSFRHACIGCHDAGGNIIVPGATLFAKDLVRNGINSEEDIYRIIYSGKGRMPGFGENCTPKGQCTFGPRLQDEEIKLLAEFVKSQADQGWPQHPN